MVQVVVELSDDANRLVGMFKAARGLGSKSEAVGAIIEEYAAGTADEELRPEYAKKLQRIRQGRYLSRAEFEKRVM